MEFGFNQLRRQTRHPALSGMGNEYRQRALVVAGLAGKITAALVSRWNACDIMDPMA